MPKKGNLFKCSRCGILMMNTECITHKCSGKPVAIRSDFPKPCYKFTWNVDLSSLAVSSETFPVSSDTFLAGGFPWRLNLFKTGKYLSIFLAVGRISYPQPRPPPPNRKRTSSKRRGKTVTNLIHLDHGWRRFAQFGLSIIDQKNSEKRFQKDTEHIYNVSESSWGFKHFLRVENLIDPAMGYVHEDHFTVEVTIQIPSEISHFSHDSRKETGYLGLKNHGSNGYFNSLLQMLYHIPCLRKSIYRLPTGKVQLALQHVVYKLQFGNRSVSTKHLDPYVCGMEKYIQNVVFNFLKDAMQGSDFGSILEDLQLDVKGCQDVYASFDRYVEDARNGDLFVDFPPVLVLNLRRFENDSIIGTMIKINDHHLFPLQLDLDRENGKYLSPCADRSVRNLYTLQSVVFHDGHFRSYIRPNLSGKWFKFDDERVTEEDLSRSLVELYRKSHILVYVRVSDKEQIICNVDEDDIPEHLRMKLKNELEEKLQKEKVKRMTHRIVKVARSEDLQEQIGKNIYFDLVDHDSVRSFCVERNMQFRLFKKKIAEEFGVPVDCQRFWMWGKRDDFTYRVHRFLRKTDDSGKPRGKTKKSRKVDEIHGEAENGLVGQLREVNDDSMNGELKLFLEVQLGQDLKPVPLPELSKQEILLFFKLYDPLQEKLRYAGMLFVKKSGRPSEILTKLNEMAGFAPDQDIELYEEKQFKPTITIERIEQERTFCASQLKNGDILCFQKSLAVESVEQYRHPDVLSFLRHQNSSFLRLHQAAKNP